MNVKKFLLKNLFVFNNKLIKITIYVRCHIYIFEINLKNKSIK